PNGRGSTTERRDLGRAGLRNATTADCRLPRLERTRMRLPIVLAAAISTTARAAAPAIADGFLWLNDVAPPTAPDVRSLVSDHFPGRPVAGYEAPECILTQGAAEALLAVQVELAQSRLSLKVYDCYRPQRAVDDFIAWAAVPEDQATKAEFYPR